MTFLSGSSVGVPLTPMFESSAIGENMVHGSDSPESAAREAALFFGDLR